LLLRASQPALLAAGRLIADSRDALVAEWSTRLGDKLTASSSFPQNLVQRHLRLLVDLTAESVGPFRREVMPIWMRSCERYGRTAAARGLAAGEVVEELQHLRELLTVHLAPAVTTMRPRQSLAIMLRLNRLVDRGIATGVVGYTDSLVATLFAQNGVPHVDAEHDLPDLERQLARLEHDLAVLSQRT
jgi:hypothetical protein